MKKMIICACIILLGAHSFGQQLDTAAASRRTALLVKSKSQKSGGWVLLGTGSALALGGYFVGNVNPASFNDAATGIVMGGLGILAALGSIRLFVASGKNKRLAAGTVSLQIKPFDEAPIADGQYYLAQLNFKVAF